jgi:septum site-determining protein MinC
MAIKTDNCTASSVLPDEVEEKCEVDATSDAPLPATLYIRQTLRSGQCVSHKGHLVIIGDINPGAEVMADGDITVWGSLRGIAHAGIGGNTNAEIRAINLQPIQIRIANAIARSPDRKTVKYTSSAAPEMAKLVEGKVKVFKYKFN